MFDKAVKSGADVVSPDLQDSTPADRRPEARLLVARWIDSVAGVQVIVRTSAVKTPDFVLDVDAVVRNGLTGLRIPDVEGPDDVLEADRIISDVERSRGLVPNSIRIIPIAETARGVYNLYQSLCAAERVIGTAFPGAEGGDLARDMGLTWTLEGSEFSYVRQKILFDARAAGKSVILDSVFADLHDAAGFEQEAVRGKQFGYTGKLAIHPSQVPVINRVHSPSATQIEDARELIKAYDQAERAGSGAVSHRGKMIDIAMRKTAEAFLLLAEK